MSHNQNLVLSFIYPCKELRRRLRPFLVGNIMDSALLSARVLIVAHISFLLGTLEGRPKTRVASWANLPHLQLPSGMASQHGTIKSSKGPRRFGVETENTRTRAFSFLVAICLCPMFGCAPNWWSVVFLPSCFCLVWGGGEKNKSIFSWFPFGQTRT